VTFNPLSYLAKYDEFFQGPSFKPRDYVVDGRASILSAKQFQGN